MKKISYYSVALLVVSLLWWLTPDSGADLNNWNDGQSANITISNLTQNGRSIITNGISTNVPVTINTVTGSSSNALEIFSGGTRSLQFSGFGGNITANGTVNAGGIQVGTGGANFNATTTSLTLNGNAILSGESSGVLQLGTDAASPVAQSLKACDGSGTDKSGATLTVQGGQSTGTGVPGDLIYRTSLYTNGSGSTANAYTERGRIVGRPSALTNATATSFQRFTMATNTQAGIQLFCTVTATDASFNKQSISSSVRVDAVNVSGTITATVSSTDNTLAANTGTLTIAYTVVDEGSNVLAIRANANSSLTTPTVKTKWVIQALNSDGAITVTPVQL